MSGTVAIVGGDGQELEQLVVKLGLRAILLAPEVIGSSTPVIATNPDLALVDVRLDAGVIDVVASLKRRYPSTAVAVVAKALEPSLLLAAMRAGVSEVLAEPLSTDALRTAIDRLVVPKAHAQEESRVVAVVGAKGGVGATTVAVNLAESTALLAGRALLIDLHVTSGDTGVFLGVEPRFTVVEALENTARLDNAYFKGLLTRTKSGLELLGSSSRVVQGNLDPQRVRTLLSFVANYSPTVILDVPRHDLSLLESLDGATHIFVVVNQELPTIRNAHPLMLRLRQRYGDRVALLVNRADKTSEIALDDIKKALGPPIRHVFPNDYRRAMTAANRGIPIATSREGRLSESFYDLATALVGGAADGSTDSGRLFGWLSRK